MNSTQLHTFVSQALPLTQKSCMAFRHAALIIRNGKIVATGYNTEKRHAEINAILNLQRLLCGESRKERY